MYRLAIAVLLISNLANADNDYRTMVEGHWACQTYLQTDYGNTLVVGEATLERSGDLTGRGNLALKHPSFTTEIPLAFELKAEWLMFKTQVIASNIDGRLYSESPLLNSVAAAIQQQIGNVPFFAAQLKAIGPNTMVLGSENNTDIQCVRQTQSTK